MAELDNLPHLLGQIADIRKQAEENLPADHRFNLFRVLERESNEIQLHSRFIGELLDPQGSHGMKDAFLRSFAQHCNFAQHIRPASLDYEKAQVRREHKNIDLLIDDGTYFVVLENKIYAGDQPQQLKRYHTEAAKLGKPTLYYLTLRGHNPSPDSLGGSAEDALDTKSVQNISYDNEITAWLDECIGQATHLPILHAALIQYQKLVQKLTGTASTEVKYKLTSLLEQGQNGPDAALIANNWRHVRHHVEFYFWTELEKLVAECHNVSPDAKFSPDTIHRAINHRRNRKTGYGIRATIGTINGYPVQFKINRGDGRLNYGLPRLKNAKPGPNSDALNKAQQLLDDVFNKSEATGFWLVEEPSKRNINFEAFTEEETTQLINKATRQEAVKALWKEVETLADEAILKIEAARPGEFVRHPIS